MTSTQVRIRRDTAANLDAATPANSELGHDTTNKRIVVGDGTTLGGIRIPNANDVQQNTFTYAVAGGTANALTLTLAPAFQSYASGAGIIFKAADTNTASATINVNGLGVRTLQKISGGVLVDLVAGDIVSGGVYQALYDGTVFQLKGLAAGGNNDAGLVLLDTKIASASATLDFTAFSSDYDNYVFVLQGLICSTATHNLIMRVSTDGGSSYISSSSYGFVQVANDSGSTSTTVTRSDGTSQMNIGGDTLTDTSWIYSGKVELFDANNASNWTSIASRVNANVTGGGSGKLRRFVNDGHYFGSTVVNAVQFLFSAGNITSGTIRMYGYKI